MEYEYKVLFLDIDGTIIKPDHTYTESTKEAITQILKSGMEVFIATGRPIHEVKNLAKELHIQSIIGQNGALAVYNNKTIVEEPMNRKQIERFLDIAKENSHELILFTNEKNYVTSMDHPKVQYFLETFQMNNNAIFTEAVIERILGVTVMNVDPEQTALYEFEDKIRLSQVNVEGNKHAYDIIRTNVNKGEAVKKVLQYLQISKEQAIAFGDGMNDKEMLQAVGESFAMENANPNLFQYAKYKTASVTDSGIYHGLKTLGLVK
ncbi:HAD family hydrolase [Niallia endozanthoxylica]|uniref:HAD family phosphatase n=1 Tax=Niallia endozanthoxylica TaxID=2036016 RepID=A0A5J5I1K8_9BACI|nr:HAD family hydrolase [Niallia endozanthoxylica]KAA9028420.1 HAD family phosphatase [Niallia endozanthoxylica]